jgi:small subunit ribosomal protein S17
MAKKTEELKVEKTGHKRVVDGIVVSNKMQKTIVVKVDRRVRHQKYKKYITVSSKFKAHDETNSANVGDRVEIIESRPLSRDKRWALRKIVAKAKLQETVA